MKAGRHPLVAALLGAVGAAAFARIERDQLDPVAISNGRANSRWRQVVGASSNGSARVKRAAQKRRNVARNRRNHRG